MKTNLLKRKMTGILSAALLVASVATPAMAATQTFKFTRSGNTYGITSTASGFSGYVTAWAKVTNTNTGVNTYNSNRGYKSASASATRTISNANYVNRTGGAYSS